MKSLFRFLLDISGLKAGSGHFKPLGEVVWRGAQCLQPVPALLAGRVQHGPQHRMVSRSGRTVETAGDLLLHLEGAECPLGRVVGRQNRGIAGEPQHPSRVVPQPQDPVASPITSPRLQPSGLAEI